MLLLFAVVLLAYFPALNGGLLLDDDLHITKPDLQSLEGLRRIWFEIGATQQYYPVLHSAFWLEHRLWGDSVAGYHLVNVLLHAGSACLVVVLMRRLRLPGAWLAAFLFALHPVCVESVAWIAEQKNTLSTFFALCAVIAYLGFDRNRGSPAYGLAFVFFALALLSKTVAVTLPAVLLVIIWWQRSRIDIRRDFLPLLPWFALGGAACLVTLSVEHTLLEGVGAAFAPTPLERMLLAGRVFWFYVGELVWPVGLTFFYPLWSINAAVWWQYLFPLASISLGAGLWWVARRRRGPLAGFLCFVGTLLPVLGFVNVEWFVFSYVGDHLQYFSMLAAIVPVAAGAAMGADRLSGGLRWTALAVTATAVVALGALTWRQSGRYRDAVTFYSAALALNPASAAAHDHLGIAHYNLGHSLQQVPGGLNEAIGEYEEALRLKPNYAEADNNLGSALEMVPGRLNDAIIRYRDALRTRPDFAGAHYNLANALAKVPGRLDEAVAHFKEALRLEPGLVEAHYNLANALEREPGRLNEAVAQYEEALRLNPDFTEAHNSLGNAFETIPGRSSEAVSQFREALRQKPENAATHFNLGFALQALPGRLDEAVAQYEEALRLKPDYAAAHYNLACILQTIPGRLTDAIAQYEYALRLEPDNAEAHSNLGNALNSLGRTSEAIAQYEKALLIEPGNATIHFDLGVVLLDSPGHTSEAIAQLKEVVRLQPDNAAARRILARIDAIHP